MIEPKTRTAVQTLDDEFLLIRAKLLEIAASLDRIERAPGEAGKDTRVSQIHEAIALLRQNNPDADLAERLQLIFSLPYPAEWKSEFGIR